MVKAFLKQEKFWILASKEGIVEKSGAWYSYNGDRIGQGRENAKTFLER